MTSIIPAVRVASAAELAYLRTDGQHSKIYLAFPQPAIVFKAMVNDVAPNCDMAVWVSYDDVTVGAYADIKPDMTLWIGSSEGACDLGIARIRKAASSTKLFIGRTSEVKFADNVFLTVIDEYGLWPRIKYIQEGSDHIDFMDFDVAYTDQHTNLDPVPIMGPDRVLFYQGALGGGNTIQAVMDGSASYCLGSTITAYLWTAPGASSTSGLTTATPTFTYNAPGTYRITLKVTAETGAVFTGFRTIMVFDNTALPVSDFKLNSCSGDYTTGGWSFKATMYDNADLGLVRDRAKCILFARDWYGDTTTLTNTGISFESSSKKIKKSSGLSIFTKGMTIRVSGSTYNNGEYTVVTSNTAYLVVDKALIDESAGASMTINSLHGRKETSIGQVVGAENIICEGWIAKEDLNMDIQGGTAAFTVYGPQHWFDQMEGYISGLLDSQAAPDWNYVTHLTVDSGLWDLLHWRSTATRCIDCFMSGDTQGIPAMENTSIGSMWEEFVGQAARGMKICCCDRYGRFFLERDGQLTDPTIRAYTNVMTVEAYDRTGEIVLERLTVPTVDLVDLTGVWYDGTTGYAVRGLAGGHLMGRYGKTEVDDTVVFASQYECTMMAGLLLAKKNNKYPTMTVELASNMRLVDICPQQQLFIAMTTDENPREISVSNNIFVRRLTYNFDDKSKSLNTQIDGEPEVTETVNTIPGEVPVPDQPPTDDWVPPIVGFSPWFPLPSLPPTPPPPDEPLGPCPDNSPEDLDNWLLPHSISPYAAWNKLMLTGDSSVSGGNTARAMIRCTLRSATADFPSYIEIPVGTLGDSGNYLHVYAIDPSGSHLATGSITVIDDAITSYGPPAQHRMLLHVDFAPTDATDIAGFEIDLDTGYCFGGIKIVHGKTPGDMTDPYGASCNNDWGTASYTLEREDLDDGYIRMSFSGSIPNTDWIRGTKFSWWANFHNFDPGASGPTTAICTYTAAGVMMAGVRANTYALNVLLPSGVLETVVTGPGTYGCEIDTLASGDPVQSFAIVGTLELYYGSMTTLFRSVSLGTLTTYNVCWPPST